MLCHRKMEEEQEIAIKRNEERMSKENGFEW